jgi:SAM-dependent methyltransferase
MSKCPLCQSESVAAIAGGYLCKNCDFIFKDPGVFVSLADQKHRYDQHKNSLDNEGYVESLMLLWDPVKDMLVKKNLSVGLDYGSGPTPVLAEIMKKDGFDIDIYDPIYAPEISSQSYDFITSTEVIEHFEEPKKEFAQISKLLKPGGIFAGLTQFHSGPEKFKDWWYQRDPTHVGFYSEKTFQSLAPIFSMQVVSLKKPLFVFEKKVSS